ncbi:phage tail domain-containing protein [Clostridium sp.]|uniref:phage distal tail protein n=1 Tax=Clostridium sp. TaxID=1506 RepID=UPI003216FD1A
MRIDIINKRTNNTVTLESYVYSSGILITNFYPGNVSATFNKVKGIGQYGSSLSSSTIEERPIEIKAIILSDDIMERNTIKRNLDDVLNPLDTIIIKYNNDGLRKQIECSPEASPLYSTDYKTNNKNALAFTVSFECFNPFWMDQEETVLNVETWEGGFEFEFELSSLGIEFARKGPNEIEINNYGNVEAPLEVFFKGPALNPSITLNYGKFIKVDRNLEDDEILYINTSFDNKAVQVMRGDIEEQAYHYINIDTKFFNLDPGKNLISYATDGDFLPQSVVIKYKYHYFSL